MLETLTSYTEPGKLDGVKPDDYIAAHDCLRIRVLKVIEADVRSIYTEDGSRFDRHTGRRSQKYLPNGTFHEVRGFGWIAKTTDLQASHRADLRDRINQTEWQKLKTEQLEAIVAILDLRANDGTAN